MVHNSVNFHPLYIQVTFEILTPYLRLLLRAHSASTSESMANLFPALRLLSALLSQKCFLIPSLALASRKPWYTQTNARIYSDNVQRLHFVNHTFHYFPFFCFPDVFQVGEDTHFSIHVKNQSGAPAAATCAFDVNFDGPAKPSAASVKEVEKGRYDVTYNLPQPGQYKLSVRYAYGPL